MRILLVLIIVAVFYIAYQWSPRGNSGSNGPAEAAGKKIDSALHNVGEAVEDLGERLQDKTKVDPTPNAPLRVR